MAELLEFRRDGDCLWIAPRANAEFNGTPAMLALTQELERSGTTRLIVDLSALKHFGSSILAFLIVLWRKIARQNGRLILYGPSATGREVVAIARLDQLWPIAETAEEAFQLAHEANAEV
jgi:anti-anti-sigma factor